MRGFVVAIDLKTGAVRRWHIDTLKNKALIEDCTVNIDHDTIWLHGTGVGFSVEDGYLYVRERGNDNVDDIAKWKLPKRSSFFNKTRDYKKEFKALVELLVSKKEKVRKEARKLAEETMQQEANDAIIKKLGLSTDKHNASKDDLDYETI